MNEKDNWPEKQKRLWQLRAREDAREEEGDKGETGQKGDNRGSQVWSWWGTKMTYGDLDSRSLKKKNPFQPLSKMFYSNDVTLCLPSFLASQ